MRVPVQLNDKNKKRILANRLSAKLSNEKKKQHIKNLENEITLLKQEVQKLNKKLSVTHQENDKIKYVCTNCDVNSSKQNNFNVQKVENKLITNNQILEFKNETNDSSDKSNYISLNNNKFDNCFVANCHHC